MGSGKIAHKNIKPRAHTCGIKTVVMEMVMVVVMVTVLKVRPRSRNGRECLKMKRKRTAEMWFTF